MNVIDLFAGPGGWDVAAHSLDFAPVGIEWDDSACATRKAAGLRTVQADVAQLDPESFAGLEFGGGWRTFGVEGVIASPPCQAWSMAGKRGGEEDKPLVYQALHDLERGDDTRRPRPAGRRLCRVRAADGVPGGGPRATRADLAERCTDPRSLLVVEPLRWALALEPTWIALEQVPPVLELWQEYASILRMKGWRVWTGVLSAERYGVPQIRKRAILLAHRDRYPAPPPATHQEYVPGESAREEHTLEGVLLPWVSMAEALGWTDGQVGFPRRADEGASTEDGYRERDFRSTDEPAFNLTEKARSWTLRTNDRANATERDANEPAPTITSGHDHGERRWMYRDGRSEDFQRGDVPTDQPAPTLGSTARLSEWVAPDGCGDPLRLKGDDWPDRRPANTIAGDSRVFQPGGHHGEGEQSQNAVRVTVQEAAILQGFSPDYPWRGSRTKQFEQVGNAVPPPLARAVLGQVVGVDECGTTAGLASGSDRRGCARFGPTAQGLGQ